MFTNSQGLLGRTSANRSWLHNSSLCSKLVSRRVLKALIDLRKYFNQTFSIVRFMMSLLRTHQPAPWALNSGHEGSLRFIPGIIANSSSVHSEWNAQQYSDESIPYEVKCTERKKEWKGNSYSYLSIFYGRWCNPVYTSDNNTEAIQDQRHVNFGIRGKFKPRSRHSHLPSSTSKCRLSKTTTMTYILKIYILLTACSIEARCFGVNDFKMVVWWRNRIKKRKPHSSTASLAKSPTPVVAPVVA